MADHREGVSRGVSPRREDPPRMWAVPSHGLGFWTDQYIGKGERELSTSRNLFPEKPRAP